MRKLVLGIIAVICLDVAFIIYPGANRPAEPVSATINNPSRPLNPIAAGPVNEMTATARVGEVVSDQDTENVDVNDLDLPVAPHSTMRRRRQSEIAQVTSAKRIEGSRVNVNAQFKPIVITIGNANTSLKSPDRQYESLDRPKKDGADDRSFISAVVPIVKKPYEWIKFLGSKLR